MSLPLPNRPNWKASNWLIAAANANSLGKTPHFFAIEAGKLAVIARAPCRFMRHRCRRGTLMLQRVRAESQNGSSAYDHYVNPQWSRLLDVLQMNVTYTRCRGAELETSDGRVILDFLSGYCVHNLGHNHPRLIEALKLELDRKGPAMLQ